MKTIKTNSLTIHDKLIDCKSQIDFSKLVFSIREFGIIEPIKVVDEDGELLIIDGVRRWCAAQELELDSVPISVINPIKGDIIIDSILRNTTTKRSYREIIEALKVVLGMLGSSQGKKRKGVDGLENMELGDACDDRYKLAGKILDIDMSGTLVRNLLKIDEFDSSESNGLKDSLIDKMEFEGMTISRAYEIVERVQKESKTNKKLSDQLLDPMISENYQIFHLDNKKAFEVLESNSIDLQYCSPDYLDARNYRGVDKKDQVGQLKLDGYINELVDLSLPFKDRILKETGVFVFNVSDIIKKNQSLAIPQRLTLSMINAGWHFVQELKWIKSNPTPITEFRGFRPSTESILVFVKDSKKYHWNELRILAEDPTISIKKTGSKFVVDSPNKRLTDCFDETQVSDLFKTSGFNRSEFDEIDPNYNHQAPQNEEIPINLIGHYTDIGMRVCDLFGGSGTTGAAALKNGRDIITFDLDPMNIDFMSKRFKHIVDTSKKFNLNVPNDSFFDQKIMSIN
jgi:DNA modification methylase